MNRVNAIHQRDVILDVRRRWLEQYSHYDPNYEIGHPKKEPIRTITERLKALDLLTCRVDDVDQAIGATGWADNECDICHKSKPLVIRFGDDPDYEARWQDICPECLGKAAKLAARTKRKK